MKTGTVLVIAPWLLGQALAAPTAVKGANGHNVLTGEDLAKLGIDLKGMGEMTTPLSRRSSLNGLSGILALVRPILDGVQVGGDDAHSGPETESVPTTLGIEPTQVPEGVVDKAGALASGERRGLPVDRLLNKLASINTGNKGPDTTTDSPNEDTSSKIVDSLGSGAGDMVKQAIAKLAETIGLGEGDSPQNSALDGVLDKVGPIGTVKEAMKIADSMVSGAASTFVKSVGDAAGDAVEQAVEGNGELGAVGDSKKRGLGPRTLDGVLSTLGAASGILKGPDGAV